MIDPRPLRSARSRRFRRSLRSLRMVCGAATVLAACASCAGPATSDRAATVAEPAPERPLTWTLEDERAHVARREDPAAWNTDRVQGDLQLLGMGRPFLFGAFPVPFYDLLGEGSYGGGGNRATFTPWRDRIVVGMGYSAGANQWNEAEVGERDDFVFVHFVVPLEAMPTEADPRMGALFASRNHPHLTAQGWFGPDATDVEYVAFQAANGEAWAIVNLRLFDLRAGRCILIAPQPDGSIRTRQIDAPTLSADELEDYHRSLLEDPAVIAFFETSLGE